MADVKTSSFEKSSKKFKEHVGQNKEGNFTEALCRETSRDSNKRLKCYYKFGDDRYLRLAPVKAEQLHLDPEVMMFHDVINDREAGALRRLAKPKLHAGPVGGSGAVMTQYRVSRIGWLLERESRLVSRISRRVSLITDMDIQNSEPLQVAHYGVGGFYKPHHDTMFDKNKKLIKGVRVATVLFYLSDVELGGATVFLGLGLTVFPKKHAAIFWRNFLPSGDQDSRFIHAACPVLRGQKWMATKWISQYKYYIK